MRSKLNPFIIIIRIYCETHGHYKTVDALRQVFFRIIALLVLSLLPSSGGHPFAPLQIVPLGRGIVIEDLLEQSVIDGVPQTSSVWVSSRCRRQLETSLPGDQLLGLFGRGGGQVGQLGHLKFPQPRIIHIPVQGQPSRNQSMKGSHNDRVEWRVLSHGPDKLSVAVMTKGLGVLKTVGKDSARPTIRHRLLPTHPPSA